jgi:hypothetical protein
MARLQAPRSTEPSPSGPRCASAASNSRALARPRRTPAIPHMECLSRLHDPIEQLDQLH